MKPLTCLLLLSLLVVSVSLFGRPTVDSMPSQRAEVPSIFRHLNQTDLLDVRISLPLDSVLANKMTEKKFEGTFHYTSQNGTATTRKIEVKPRGRSRRKVCSFPPLKIKFDEAELISDSLMGRHKSLKLVTHCEDDEGTLQNVLEEYLAYRIYNELTPNSLRAQLVKITYEDERSGAAVRRYGVLLEDIDEMAERIGGEEVEGFGKTMEAFQDDAMQLFAVFQLLIGNEDWRVEFARNVKFVQTAGNNKLLPIPYDFDASGLVNPSYANPDRDLKLQSVRQRTFMGYFGSKEEREMVLNHFQDRRAAIYELVNQFDLLGGRAKTKLIAYLDGFYDVLDSSRLTRQVFPLRGQMAARSDEDGLFR